MAEVTNINANNVTAGKPKTTGAVFRAPLGTTLPTDASSTLNVAFKSLGYISEDGITEANSRSSEEIRDWGGSVVMTVQTDSSVTFEMGFIEALNPEVLKTFYGDAAVTESAGAITIAPDMAELTGQCFVIEEVVTGGRVQRTVIPNGKVSETGEIEHRAGSAITYPVTITALPDTAGKPFYRYISVPSA